MKQTVAGMANTHSVGTTVVRVLVMSQHDAVRRELVIYLARSPTLVVCGDLFSYKSIIRARPDVLVLDLSQLTGTDLRQAIDAARRVDASLITLATMYDEAADRAVTEAGGLYRLKSATADGLADVIRDASRGRGMPSATANRLPAL